MTRPLIVLELRAEPEVDATRALRRLLRYALRGCGLRCTAIRCDALELKAAAQQDVANARGHTR